MTRDDFLELLKIMADEINVKEIFFNGVCVYGEKSIFHEKQKQFEEIYGKE